MERGTARYFIVRLPRDAGLLSAPQAPAAIRANRLLAFAANSKEINGARILVVDDEPDAREMVARVLSRAGAEVVQAAVDARSAGGVRTRSPRPADQRYRDAEQDGYDLIRQLRQLSAEAGGLVRRSH